MDAANATRACVVCGNALSKNDKKCCSDACRRESKAVYSAAHYRANYVPITIKRDCRHCAAPFETKHGKQVFCTKACQDEAKSLADSSALKTKRRECIVCGCAFTRESGGYSICSDACEAVRRKQHQVAKNKPQVLKSCPHCKAGFSAKPNVVYCSKRCKDKARPKQDMTAARKRWARSAAGKVWLAAYKVKVKTDPQLHEWDKQSRRARKVRRAKHIDSKLTKAQTNALYAERDTCLYCGCKLNAKAKVLDHMDPLRKSDPTGSLNNLLNVMLP